MSEGTLHVLMYVCIALVVIGVLLEGEEHVRDLKKEGWKPIIPKIGFAILVLGLCGELALQPFFDSAETDFRLDAKARIAASNREAADANKKAESLRLEVAQLTSFAEQERTERLKSERAVANRGLTSEQQRFLASRIVPLPCFTVGMIMQVDTPEAKRFAWDIAAIFRTAGWKVTWAQRVESAAAPAGLGMGIEVEGSEVKLFLGGVRCALETMLMDAFREAGISLNLFVRFHWAGGKLPGPPPGAFTGTDQAEAIASAVKIHVGAHPRGF